MIQTKNKRTLTSLEIQKIKTTPLVGKTKSISLRPIQFPRFYSRTDRGSSRCYTQSSVVAANSYPSMAPMVCKCPQSHHYCWQSADLVDGSAKALTKWPLSAIYYQPPFLKALSPTKPAKTRDIDWNATKMVPTVNQYFGEFHESDLIAVNKPPCLQTVKTIFWKTDTWTSYA